MKKQRLYDIHLDFLKEYENSALINAQHILDDAKILLEYKSYARAYFLSVASIEETGKAYLAFSCERRNFSDEGLKKKIKEIFESHSEKTSAAFIGWIARVRDKKKDLKTAMDLVINLKLGREKSMYVDADQNNKISIPMHIIRPVAAIDSVKVAENCLYHTKHYISENDPPNFSSYDDKMFCIQTEKITEIFKKEDFSDFLLTEIEKAGKEINFSKAIVTYHDKYFCKNKSFNGG